MTTVDSTSFDDPAQPKSSAFLSSLSYGHDRFTIYYLYDVSIEGLAFTFTNHGVTAGSDCIRADKKMLARAFIKAILWYDTLAPLLAFKSRCDGISDRRIEYQELTELLDLRIEAERFRSISKQSLVDLDALIDRIDQSIEERRSYRPTPTPKSTRQIQSGWIYLLKGPKGYYKIGRTLNVENRLKTFGIKLPFDVKFTHAFMSEDYTKTEKDLHTRFTHRRKNGEWFALTKDEVSWFCRIHKGTLHGLVIEDDDETIPF